MCKPIKSHTYTDKGDKKENPSVSPEGKVKGWQQQVCLEGLLVSSINPDAEALPVTDSNLIFLTIFIIRP